MLKRYNGRSLLCQIRKLQLDRLRLSEEKESRVDIKSYWQEVSSNVDEWVVLVSCQSEPRKGAESLWLDGQIKKDWERHHPTRKEGIKASYKECFTDNCPKGFFCCRRMRQKKMYKWMKNFLSWKKDKAYISSNKDLPDNVWKD